MAERGNRRARADDFTAARVDEALRIANRDGVHPALEYMQLAGVPRQTALRVLCSPQLHRQRERRSQPR